MKGEILAIEKTNIDCYKITIVLLTKPNLELGKCEVFQ